MTSEQPYVPQIGDIVMRENYDGKWIVVGLDGEIAWLRSVINGKRRDCHVDALTIVRRPENADGVDFLVEIHDVVPGGAGQSTPRGTCAAIRPWEVHRGLHRYHASCVNWREVRTLGGTL